MPLRRRRWVREDMAAIARLRKSDTPVRDGPVAAIGDFAGHTGLSRAAIYELDRLRQEHAEIDVIDIGDGATAPDRMAETGPAYGTLYLLSAPDTYARMAKSLVADRIREAYRIGLWVWETPVFNSRWRFALDMVHEIWTPSDYSRRSIVDSAGDIPVLVRPHYVTPAEEMAPIDRARFGVPEGAFLGLAVMDLTSCPARKNPWAHIAAWKLAFGDDPAHHLIFKLRLGKRTACVLGELQEMAAGAQNIHFVREHLSAAAIAGLQRGADVYLSLHRAEGYGLNIHECLEVDTPVVATHYSANAEYGPDYDSYYPVPYRMIPYRDWTGHYADGDFEWAEADIDAASLSLRRVARHWRTQSRGDYPSLAAQ